MNVLKCNKCDYMKTSNNYNGYRFHPKEGIPPSHLKIHYCEKCGYDTMWFMGKGLVWIPYLSQRNISRYNLESGGVESNSTEVSSIINNFKMDIDKIQSQIERDYPNIFRKLLNFRKYWMLIKEIRNYKTDLKKCEKTLHESIDNIKYYDELNPNPKCVECGNEDFKSNPKHSCGGDITIIKMEFEEWWDWKESQNIDNTRKPRVLSNPGVLGSYMYDENGNFYYKSIYEKHYRKTTDNTLK